MKIEFNEDCKPGLFTQLGRWKFSKIVNILVKHKLPFEVTTIGDLLINGNDTFGTYNYHTLGPVYIEIVNTLMMSRIPDDEI